MKPDWSQVPWRALRAAVDLLTDPRGDAWRNQSSTEHANALLRHTADWMAGEPKDRESKQSHLLHAVTNALMAAEVEMLEDSRSVKVDAETEEPVKSEAYVQIGRVCVRRGRTITLRNWYPESNPSRLVGAQLRFSADPDGNIIRPTRVAMTEGVSLTDDNTGMIWTSQAANGVYVNDYVWANPVDEK